MTAGAVAELREAYSSGADIVELRLDYLQDFEPEQDLESLLAASQLPVIVTCRPDWEGCEPGVGSIGWRLAPQARCHAIASYQNTVDRHGASAHIQAAFHGRAVVI